MPLHVVIEIMSRRFDETAIVRAPIPVIQVVEIFRAGASDDDASVRPRNQVVVIPAVEAERIRVRQTRTTGLGHYNSAAYPPHWHYFVLILRSEGGGIGIGGKDHLSRFDRAARSVDRPSPGICI